MGSDGELFEPGDLVETETSLRGADVTIVPTSGRGVVVSITRGLMEVMWDDGALYLIHKDWVAKVKET